MEYIGSGASGMVWRAVDERLERSVAVKQIFTQPGLTELDRDMVRQRAMREAKNAARFQHPNAIVVFDITEHAGDPCLVMEYLPSRSLSAAVAGLGRLPLAQVLLVGEQVASALAAAHRAGIVHRDVKPGNVLLGDDSVAKITDFGISRATGDLTLTETGLVCGTPAYLAPEVARGSDPTPASDVYALGATLYHALEGEPPHGTNTNQLAILYRAASGKVHPPKHAGPATDLLLSLLDSEPQNRPTMREACRKLASLVTEVGAPDFDATVAVLLPSPIDPAHPTQMMPAPEPEPEPASAAPRVPPTRFVTGPRLVAAGVVAVAVVLVSTVGFLLFGDPNSPGSSASTGTPATAVAGLPGESGSSQAPLTTSQTGSSGVVTDWGAAGRVVEQFYGNPAGSWDLLTPAAQQAYGSRAAFEQHWAPNPSPSFGKIDGTGANNPDGSVDMLVNGLSYNNLTKQVTVRVVDVGGRLLIDGDTR